MGLGTWLGFLFGVLAPFLVSELGWTDLQAGALTSVMYAAGAVAAPAAGSAVDHLGARRTALLVPAVVVAAHVIVASASSFAVVAGGAVVGGIALAATNPATNRLVVEGLPLAARGRAMGWKQAGVSVAGFVVGAVVPAAASRLGWRMAAAIGALVAVAALPLLLRALPREGATASAPAGAGREPGGRVGRIATYAAIMGAVNGALGAFVVLYAVGTLGLPPETGGAAVATLGLIAVGARVAWPTLGARMGSHVALLRTISVVAAAGTVLLAAVPDRGTTWLLVAAGLLGATAMSWHALAMLAAVSGVAVELVGRVSGTVIRAFYGGYVAGPLLFGLLVDRGVPYRIAWVAFGLLAALAAAVPRHGSDRDHRTTGPGIDRGHPG